MATVDINPLIVAVAALVVALTPILVAMGNARLKAMEARLTNSQLHLAARVDTVDLKVSGIRGAVEVQRGPGKGPGGVERRGR